MQDPERRADWSIVWHRLSPTSEQFAESSTTRPQGPTGSTYSAPAMPVLVIEGRPCRLLKVLPQSLGDYGQVVAPASAANRGRTWSPRRSCSDVGKRLGAVLLHAATSARSFFKSPSTGANSALSHRDGWSRSWHVLSTRLRCPVQRYLRALPGPSGPHRRPRTLAPSRRELRTPGTSAGRYGRPLRP